MAIEIGGHPLRENKGTLDICPPNFQETTHYPGSRGLYGVSPLKVKERKKERKKERDEVGIFSSSPPAPAVLSNKPKVSHRQTVFRKHLPSSTQSGEVRKHCTCFETETGIVGNRFLLDENRKEGTHVRLAQYSATTAKSHLKKPHVSFAVRISVRRQSLNMCVPVQAHVQVHCSHASPARICVDGRCCKLCTRYKKGRRPA